MGRVSDRIHSTYISPTWSVGDALTYYVIRSRQCFRTVSLLPRLAPPRIRMGERQFGGAARLGSAPGPPGPNLSTLLCLGPAGPISLLASSSFFLFRPIRPRRGLKSLVSFFFFPLVEVELYGWGNGCNASRDRRT